jgi:hypothetical protein
MRPTYLQFRSPKEQTGEFLNVSMTSDGKALKFADKTPLKSTFPRGERWQHIKDIACRTSHKVGPGCYKFPITTNKGRGPKITRDTMTSSSAWEYLYVGDALLRKERPVSRLSGMTPASQAFHNSKSFSPYTSSRRVATGPIHVDLTQARERPQSVGRGGIGNYGYSREEDLRRGSPEPRRDHDSYSNLTISQSGVMKRSTSNSRHQPKEKDFYERLSDQWEGDQKIVITNNDNNKRPVRCASAGRGFDRRDHREGRLEW